jgi:hypothetical protein
MALPTRRTTGRGNTHTAPRNAGGNRMMAEASDPHRAAVIYESRKNQTVNKWKPVLAKMREVPQKKFGLMAAILENQYNAWDPRGRSILFEDMTTTANIADFTRFALPLIRKSYPKLIADNLVGVQPMSQPASLIFYIRYRYALSKGQTIAGTQIMRQNTAQQFARQNGWALDPYYSSQEVKGEALTITGGNVVTGTLAHRPSPRRHRRRRRSTPTPRHGPELRDPTPCLRVSFDSDGNPDTVLVGDCTGSRPTLRSTPPPPAPPSSPTPPVRSRSP